MKSASFVRSITLVGSALTLTAACGGAPDGSDGLSSDGETLGRTTWGTLPARVGTPHWRTPGSSGKGGMSSGTGGTGPSPSTPPPSSGTPQSPDAIIAAARTPDGQAIPQPAGPDGSCPAVVAVLGFWACPTLGQTCSYTSGGATHACSCNRVDGEGQTPAWVCN